MLMPYAIFTELNRLMPDALLFKLKNKISYGKNTLMTLLDKSFLLIIIDIFRAIFAYFSHYWSICLLHSNSIQKSKAYHTSLHHLFFYLSIWICILEYTKTSLYLKIFIFCATCKFFMLIDIWWQTFNPY